ncbi:fluoride efflux transporter FluC [Convivina praedatoris]|uniref:Fluoride-specific ion channel FluC n=1 Tax=Convivina praedatoris TaxID=2880963 RepID=A0ABM9D4M0_9LACO|nr:CrcB family protein [Convivina sp. LMG 32447]CAH1855827.1 Putative fluoride ion transporter CrcB [Convivina sp. LMG 32447]CAH1856678.1 Putative fluoride ion transporter CrcB [Convivina sp. LMG 32447]CAH1856811.1 Putative fluoride ion transporter CrcB [Convivina sp. LMG 32447]
MLLSRKASIELIAVFAGGFLGGGLRFLFGYLPMIGHWPITTIIINWTGCLALAYLGAWMAKHTAVPHLWQTFIGTGILGGYTTFSTMILQVYQQGLLSGFLYLVATIFGGWFMVELGQWLVCRSGEQHV